MIWIEEEKEGLARRHKTAPHPYSMPFAVFAKYKITYSKFLSISAMEPRGFLGLLLNIWDKSSCMVAMRACEKMIFVRDAQFATSMAIQFKRATFNFFLGVLASTYLGGITFLHHRLEVLF